MEEMAKAKAKLVCSIERKRTRVVMWLGPETEEQRNRRRQLLHLHVDCTDGKPIKAWLTCRGVHVADLELGLFEISYTPNKLDAIKIGRWKLPKKAKAKATKKAAKAARK